MDETKIALSEKGITFPYRRYLSDSSSGFVLIFLLVILLGRSSFTQDLLQPTFPGEIRVFILVFLFLLSTPIGVVVNVISWMILESPQKFIERIFIAIGFREFKREYMFLEAIRKLGITKDNWFEKIRLLETTLANKHSIFVDRVESLRGIAIFVRNLSLLSIVVTLYLLSPASYQPELSLVFFVLSVFLLFMSAVVSFYFHVQIIFWEYASHSNRSQKTA